MARIDKYDPKDGGFRAPLGFAIDEAAVGTVIGVGLDANGRAVRGAGQTGIKGVICPSSVMNQGDPVDCMTDGEIVDVEGIAAGTNVFAAAGDGAVDGTAGGTSVGFTVQPWRLVVRMARSTAGA